MVHEMTEEEKDEASRIYEEKEKKKTTCFECGRKLTRMRKVTGAGKSYSFLYLCTNVRGCFRGTDATRLKTWREDETFFD